MSTTIVPLPATRAGPRQLPLPPEFPFAWAVAHGQDRFGLWQAFELNGVRQRLRWVPPGTFKMGSPNTEKRRGYDETLHTVRLTQGFWLADTACTQALWLAVVGSYPWWFNDGPLNPVVHVSWDDVVGKFLPAANALLPGLGLRLPTEAEWEYACREAGAAMGPFSFGDTISPEQVNYDGRFPYPGAEKGPYRERTVPVAALPPNGLGMHQMHGNVLEWISDRYGPYAGDAVDPTGPSEAGAPGRRVLRGGGWISSARDCRSARRGARDPSYRGDGFGFRLARGPLPEAGSPHAGGSRPA